MGIHDAEFDVCPSFRHCHSGRDKLENLHAFMNGVDIPRDVNGAIMNIKELKFVEERNRVVSIVLYSILVDLSRLQHNLICLERLLDFAASTKVHPVVVLSVCK